MVESRLIKKVVFIASDVGDPVQNVCRTERGWPHGNLIKPVHTLITRERDFQKQIEKPYDSAVVGPRLKISGTLGAFKVLNE